MTSFRNYLAVAMFLFGCVCMGDATSSCKNVNSAEQTALTIEGYACVLDQMANAVLPNGPVEQVASAIQQACSAFIPQGLTSVIVAILNAFLARQGDAGLPAMQKWHKQAYRAPVDRRRRSFGLDVLVPAPRALAL